MASAFVGGILLAAPGCNVLKSTTYCHQTTAANDCGRGTRCSAAGFCEHGGPVHIGAFLSLTGQTKYTAIGEAGREAFDFATELFGGRIAGGPEAILGRGIAFDLVDDGAVVDGLDTKSDVLIANNPVAAIGPIFSSQVFETQKKTLAAKLLQVAPFAGARLVGEAQSKAPEGRYLFQLSPDIYHGSPRAMVKYLTENSADGPSAKTCKELGIIANDDTTGVDYVNSFSDHFRNNCLSLRYVKKIPATLQAPTFYDGIVADFAAGGAAANTSCLLYSVNPDVAGAIALAFERRAPALAGPRYHLATSLLRSANLFDTTKSAYAGREILSLGWYGVDVDAAPVRQEVVQLLDLYNKYLEAHDRPAVTELPDRFAQYFDAAAGIALALELAGPDAAPETFRDAYLAVTSDGGQDTAYGPASLGDLLAAVRREKASFPARAPAVNYNGAAADIEFLDFGFIEAPTFVWKVAKTSDDYEFAPIRRYSTDDLRSVDGMKACP